MVILAQQAGQFLSADSVRIVEEDDRAFADAVIAVVGDCGGLVPGFAAVFGAGENDGEFLGVAAHDVGGYAESAVGQIEDAVGLESHDVGLLGFRPGIAVVVAPVEPVAGGLIFVEVAVVVVVDDDDEAAVVEAAETGCDQPFVALLEVGLVDLAVFEPGAAAVIAGEQGKNLIYLRPVGVGVGIDQHESAGRQFDDIRVLGKASGAAPDVKDFMGDGTWMNMHSCSFVIWCGWDLNVEAGGVRAGCRPRASFWSVEECLQGGMPFFIFRWASFTSHDHRWALGILQLVVHEVFALDYMLRRVEGSRCAAVANVDAPAYFGRVVDFTTVESHVGEKKDVAAFHG